MLTVVLESESTQVFACQFASLAWYTTKFNSVYPLIITLLQEGNFKEIFKTDEGNFVQNEEKL